MKLLLVLTVSLFSVAAIGKMDTKAKMKQLEENSENAISNRDQYKENYEISKSNEGQAWKAQLDLKKKRKQLVENGKNIEKNKKLVDKMKLKIQSYKTAEAKKMEKDLAELKKLQDLVTKMQAQIEKRQTNITAYDQKIAEVEKEKQLWDKQKASMKDILVNIDKKYADIEKQRVEWKSKKTAYKNEMDKWNAEAKVAERTYKKYNSLTD